MHNPYPTRAELDREYAIEDAAWEISHLLAFKVVAMAVGGYAFMLDERIGEMIDAELRNIGVALDDWPHIIEHADKLVGEDPIACARHLLRHLEDEEARRSRKIGDAAVAAAEKLFGDGR